MATDSNTHFDAEKADAVVHEVVHLPNSAVCYRTNPLTRRGRILQAAAQHAMESEVEMPLASLDHSQAVPIRRDLIEAIDRAWRHLSRPGTWWTGALRLRMVAEARNATHCALCRQRKAALSPYTVTGAHRSLGELPETVVEVIHRISTDAGRLTEKWVRDCLENDITDGEYVEIVGLVATITALDTFAKAMGKPLRPLPQALPGEPTRHRPNGATKSIAWVPTVSPQNLQPGDVDPYSRYGAMHIQQALSLVPDSVIGFFDLDIALYLQQDAIRDFATEYRAISHAQLEFIAAKASLINGCYY